MDLTPYILLHPAIPWPVPAGVRRFGLAVQELVDSTALIGSDRRTAIIDTTFASFADTADLVRRTVSESEGWRCSLRDRVRELLEDSHENAGPEEA